MASTLAGPLKYLTVSPIAAHTATVVFIHGLGDSGHGWKPVAEMFSADPAMQHIKWIFPHAPNMAVTANGGMVMPSWYDIYSFGGLKEEEDEEGILRSAKAIKQLIDSEISTTSIQPSRVVIGGFSQGGVMSLLTGMTMDKKLAGIVGLSCYLTLRAKFKEMSNPAVYDIPVFIGHGTHDPLIKSTFALETVQVLKSFGLPEAKEGSPSGIEFHTYQGLAHSTSSEELVDLKAWLKKVVPA